MSKNRQNAPPAGTKVAANGGPLADVDPFSPLIVTAVHTDGTVDVTESSGREWHHVPVANVTVVHDG